MPAAVGRRGFGFGKPGSERIAFNLIQIEGNPRPVQAGNVAVAFLRVNPNKGHTL
jgi:hypothetical protein